MNRRKIIALALCAVLALGLLAGCGAAKTAPEPTAEPTAEPAADPTAEPADAETEEETADADAAYQAIVDELKRVGGTYDPDTVVCTVDGEDVTWSMYYYLITDELQSFLYYTGALPTDYGEQLTEDRTLGDYLKEMAVTKSKYYAVAHTRAAAAGVQLSQEAEAELQDYWAQMEEAYGGAEGLQQALDESNLTQDLFLYLLRCSRELEALMDSTYGTAGEKMAPEDVIAWARDGGYIRVKHILYFFYDDAGQPMDDEGKEQQRLRAETTLAELQALSGDNEALEERFNEIMTADSGDAGGLSRFPEGYTFTAGTMYPEFEDAAFAMEEFALSELVESQSGYHIILRLPLDTEGLTMDQDANTGEYLTLRQSAANDLFAKDMAAWMEAAEVEWAPGFEDLDMNALFGVGPEAE